MQIVPSHAKPMLDRHVLASLAWAESPPTRLATPPQRPRLLAVASLSRGVGRTTVSRALARALCDDGAQAVVVSLDTRQHHAPAPASSVPELPADALPELLAGSPPRPGFALLDLPPNPCVDWARGLEAADDVLVLVQPTRDDLSTLGAWFLPRLSRVHLLAVRVDPLSTADRRGLERLRRVAGDRLLDVALHEDTGVANAGAGRLGAGPSSEWLGEVRAIARWVRET